MMTTDEEDGVPDEDSPEFTEEMMKDAMEGEVWLRMRAEALRRAAAALRHQAAELEREAEAMHSDDHPHAAE